MLIKINKTDCQNIVNQNLRVGGGGNSELEVALAKKCLVLYDRLGEINNVRNEYFEAIYSATVKFEKATKGTLMHKRAADLARDSKAHFATAVKLDGQLKDIMEKP
jgi:hypothetical protein